MLVSLQQRGAKNFELLGFEIPHQVDAKTVFQLGISAPDGILPDAGFQPAFQELSLSKVAVCGWGRRSML